MVALPNLFEPTFDTNKFEESFSNWEYDIQQFESDSNARLPDQAKVAVLMNRTRGQLQQHLHLNAAASPTYAEMRTTITEYQRAYTTFRRIQHNPPSAVSTNYSGGTAPMDIGAISKGKYRGKGEGNTQRKERQERQQRKGLRKLWSTSIDVKLQHTRKRKTSWTRNALRKVHRTRKRISHMLQVWSTRTHNENMQSFSV